MVSATSRHSDFHAENRHLRQDIATVRVIIRDLGRRNCQRHSPGERDVHRHGREGRRRDLLVPEGVVGRVFRSLKEVKLESIRKMLARAADTGYSKWHNAEHARR